jgi:glycopeptide antibiotics resistance protein
MNIPNRFISILLFSIYLFVLVKLTIFRTSVTLFAIEFPEENGYITSFQTAYERANFIPFYSIYYYLISKQEPILVGLINVIGNVILFIPFGFFLPFIWKQLRRFKTMATVILYSSLSIEALQLLFAIGSFDVDDVILNIIGSFIGYLLYSVSLKTKFPDKQWK